MFQIIAEQSQYTLAYALIGAIIFLGFLVVCIPRPRKKVYKSEEAEKDAKKKAELARVRAKNKKSKMKRQKARKKAAKKRS